MAITAKSSGKERELVPAGNYFAVVVGVFDIGTQPPNNPKYDPVHKVILQFELHRKKGVCRDKEEKPLRISGFYPLAFGRKKNKEKAKLRQAVEGILGRSFTEEEAKEGYDIAELLDTSCRLVVAHDTGEDGTMYDQIQSLSPLEEDDPEPRPESDSILYEMDPDSEIPDEVPEWVQRMIKKSKEWRDVNGDGDGKPSRGGHPKTGVSRPSRAKSARKGKDDDESDDDDDDMPF